MARNFTIFPAIDLRGGRVVRLKQGRVENETRYGDDPAAIAQDWQAQGAAWLHVVDLDRALGTKESANSAALKNILLVVQIPVQFGGGLRDLELMRRAFELGVSRAVIGTAAIEQPNIVADAVREFGAERVVIAMDMRDGIIATRGWLTSSGMDAYEFGKQMHALGARHALVTDIARDGMLQGIDAAQMAHFARKTGLSVIASGGVASLNDIENLLVVAQDGVEGVIVGQALYAGVFTYADALQVTLDAALEMRRKTEPRHGEG